MPEVQDPVLEQAKTEARFWAKVDKTGSCWVWTGAHNGLGYGTIRWRGKVMRAHRVAYGLLVGEIPAGLTIDHLCRTRDCVNPQHLEAVSQRINTLRGETVTAANIRKVQCPRGHPYDLFNTYYARDGSRECKACWPFRRK